MGKAGHKDLKEIRRKLVNEEVRDTIDIETNGNMKRLAAKLT